MNYDRDKLKKDFGGQALNRYERVCALLKRYIAIKGNPDKYLIELASNAIMDSKYMPDFVRKIPRKIPYHKRDKAMHP